MYVILGNALDNAVEANLRGQIDVPYIDLKMVYDDGNLTIVIENAFDGEVKERKSGQRVTRKKDVINHGLSIFLIFDVKYLSVNLYVSFYKQFVELCRTIFA